MPLIVLPDISPRIVTGRKDAVTNGFANGRHCKGYVDAELGADGGERQPQMRCRQDLSQRIAVVAVGDHAGILAPGQNPRIRRGRPVAVEDQSRPAFTDTVVADLEQRLAADEVSLVEPDPAIEADMERRAALVHVDAMRRIGLFEPEREHGKDAIRLQAEIAANAHQHVPDGGRFVGGHEQLEAEFAGDAGARDQHLRLADAPGGERPAPQPVEICIRNKRLEEFARARALYGREGDGRCDVGDIGPAPGRVMLQPGQHLQAIDRASHQHEVLGRQPKHGEVVHDAAIVAADGGIAHLAGLHGGGVVDNDVVDQRLGVRPLDVHLAHRAEVLDTDIAAGVQVFVGNAGIVFGRDEIAADPAHMGAQPDNAAVERGSPLSHRNLHRLPMEKYGLLHSRRRRKRHALHRSRRGSSDSLVQSARTLRFPGNKTFAEFRHNYYGRAVYRRHGAFIDHGMTLIYSSRGCYWGGNPWDSLSS